MPSNIDSQYGAITALAYGSTWDNLDLLEGDSATAGAVSVTVDESGSTSPPAPVAPQVEIFYKIATGPTNTANSLIEFYFARAKSATTSDFATEVADAVITGATGTPKSQMQFVHAQVVVAVADIYRGSFIVDNPGPFWQLVIWNGTGDDFSGTASPHSVHYRYISPEVQ
jgi:hypothetical protein